VSERVTYLRKVAALTFVGLIIAAVASAFSMGVLFAVPALMGTIPSAVIMLGGIFGARYVGRTLVNSSSVGTQYAGFVLGTALQGMAMGFVVLMAVVLSSQLYSNPFVFLGQGLGLVGLTVFSMVAYLATGPKEMNWLRATLATVAVPMLVLMVVSFIFPMGGVLGMLLSAVFVAVSAGGLLYSLNHVMHRMDTSMHVQGAYHITLGMLVLIWNVLVLLMRLQRR